MESLNLETYLVMIIGIFFLLDKSRDRDSTLVKSLAFAHMAIGAGLSYY
jgi:uncharacterized membrane protein